MKEQQAEKEKVLRDSDLKKPKGKAGKPKNADADEWTRQTFVIRKVFVQKLRDLGYWNRQTTKVVLDTALKEFFRDKDIKPLP